jgi:hypothetical protein
LIDNIPSIVSNARHTSWQPSDGLLSGLGKTAEHLIFETMRLYTQLVFSRFP